MKKIFSPPSFIKTIIYFAAIFFFANEIYAQQKYTLSGYVRDSSNGETLIGANVFIKETLKGSTTNEYGFYSITLPQDTYTLVVSYIGYNNVEKQINLTENRRENIELQSSVRVTEEVVISSERKDKNVESTQMGTIEMSVEQLKSVPVLFGEADILKTIQLLPGVQSSGEGNSGLYVRGGGPDQNLILLDEAVVYNPGHLFGFFSVFNSDALKNVTLMKGGIPAMYGGRLSSVLDISMKDGNSKDYELEGGIGVISSRFTVQGPIKRDVSSFMVSARRTYIDVFLKPIQKGTEFEGNTYFFYDINGKINYKFSDKDRLYLSGYFGRDVFQFHSPEEDFDVKIPWGNATATLRWNHLFSDKLFMNTSFIFNDFNFSFESRFSDFQFELFSGIRDINIKSDVDFYPSQRQKFRFGLNYTYHIFTPYTANAQTGDASFSNDSLNKKYAHELAVYIQDDIDITRRFKINIGVRGSMFMQVGPSVRYTFNEFTRQNDTISYGRSEPVKTYFGIDPRLNMRYTVNDNISLKGSVSLINQYIHLVSNATTTLPTDLWVPSSGIVKPQRGIQYAVGYFHNYKNNEYETSVELYYKDMRNQIEFGQSYVPELNVDIEESFVFGKGWSYGAEFFVNKREGKFTGWIGYTLSFTYRKFDELNNGETFPARYDRRNDLSVVAAYNINDKWKISGTFVFGTGQSITLPTGRYYIEGRIVNQYEERNGYRMEPYHRADLAVSRTFKKRERFQHELVLSVYNLYNRKNPFFIYFNVDGNYEEGTVEVGAKKVSLFPILPSLTWNFKFHS